MSTRQHSETRERHHRQQRRICLSLEFRTRNDAPEFFHTRTYISDFRIDDFVFSESEAVAEFFWKSLADWARKAGVPTLGDGGFTGWLIGYICFYLFVHCNDGDAVKPSFDLTVRKVGVSWIMSNYRPMPGESTTLQKHLWSVHYRGSLSHFSIPAHCVEYFTWLLRDAHRNWEELFSQSESYLEDRVGHLICSTLFLPPKTFCNGIFFRTGLF